MYKFKVGDKGKTRSGESYRIICTDRANAIYSIIALVGEGRERVEIYTSSGAYVNTCTDNDDLLPPAVTKWLNVWCYNASGHTDSVLHDTEDKAKQRATSANYATTYLIIAQPVEVPAS